MSEPTAIREVLLDLPLVQTDDRPEGMIVLDRNSVPQERLREADDFVIAGGGMIGQKPLFQVVGGVTPEGGPAAATFYALPPAMLVAGESSPADADA